MDKHNSRRRISVATALLLIAVAPGMARAQGQGFQFNPSITVLASFSNNALRTAGDTLSTNFLLAQAELPFRFSGRRWSGDFSYSPGYQKYRDQPELDSFHNAARLGLQARLSRRTLLQIEGAMLRTDELLGQIGNDIVLPRTTQFRGKGRVTLTHQLTRRDNLSFDAEYSRLEFPDGNQIGNQAFGAGIGYSHRLNQRLALTTTGLAQTVSFDNGTDARSVAATAGLSYRVAEHTALEFEVGALLVQQDVGSGFETVAGAPEMAGWVQLTRDMGRLSLGLRAERDMGFTSGLGDPTIRNRASAHLETGRPSWNLAGSVEFARNELLSTGPVPQSGANIDTWTGCVGGGVRIVRHVSAVGSFLFVHQVGFGGGSLDIDSYRAAVGLMFDIKPPPASARAGERTSDAFSRSVHATC